MVSWDRASGEVNWHVSCFAGVGRTCQEGFMMIRKALLPCCLLGVLLPALFCACVLPDFNAFAAAGKQEMVSIATDQLTLLWDPPAGSVDHYTVYFRIHGTSGWTSLGNAPADPVPQFTVAHSLLGDGEFDFAVTAVDAEDRMSSYHSSLDATAQPTSGWYIRWHTE
jgi:hypothetical protein